MKASVETLGSESGNARTRKAGAGDGIRLYLKYVLVSLRSQMQYRASFVMLSLGTFLTTFVEFIGLWALFDRFTNLRGWTLPEAALLYGMVHTAFAVAEALGRGFDIFPGMVKNGEFDRILLRPRSTALQIAARHVDVLRVGRFSQGLLVLLWAAWAVEVDWTLLDAALVVGSVLGGAAIFIGLFVMQATMAFWTIESLEIANTLTYGGVETAQYPLEIYNSWFRRFFTFVVPLACINFFPAIAILDRPAPPGFQSWIPWCSPMVGFVFLALSVKIWGIGVRHYHSTGS
jgi:viologen exporter family transport system permease protein